MNAIKAENLTYVYSPNTPFEKRRSRISTSRSSRGSLSG